jgi:DinB superfamily
MDEHLMETTLCTALWRQFGAAIDMLENALLACPSALWTGHLWSDHSDPPQPSEFAAFWSLTHHTLFWLDLYLTGSLEGFAPPTPFTQDEFGPARVLPEQPYPKEELHAYLVQLRQKCQTTLLSLSDEQARRQVAFLWRWWKPMSFFELQVYTLRHVQEHAAQLSLFLGQHAIPDEALDWVARAKGAGMERNAR